MELPMTHPILRALGMAIAMGWEILWPLILGFTLSAVVQAVVSHQQMSRLLPDDRPRSILTALALGAGLLIFLLCRRSPRPFDFPQGRSFYGRDGVRDGVHQSRRRAQHHHAGVPWLADHAGGVYRRPHYG